MRPGPLQARALDCPLDGFVQFCHCWCQVLRERPGDAAAVCELGLPRALAQLLARASGETGEAAMALLATLVDDPAALARLRQARCTCGRLAAWVGLSTREHAWVSQ